MYFFLTFEESALIIQGAGLVMRVPVLRAGAQSGHRAGVTRQAPSPAVLSRQSLWGWAGRGLGPGLPQPVVTSQSSATGGRAAKHWNVRP